MLHCCITYISPIFKVFPAQRSFVAQCCVCCTVFS
nr:MAG TPA: hypothetical protein [Caudoviricetes sp.]DAP87918.1 MAG TPA: hypothetical protein [Caudoviricetes sp.]